MDYSSPTSTHYRAIPVLPIIAWALIQHRFSSSFCLHKRSFLTFISWSDRSVLDVAKKVRATALTSMGFHHFPVFRSFAITVHRARDAPCLDQRTFSLEFSLSFSSCVPASGKLKSGGHKRPLCFRRVWSTLSAIQRAAYGRSRLHARTHKKYIGNEGNIRGAVSDYEYDTRTQPGSTWLR